MERVSSGAGEADSDVLEPFIARVDVCSDACSEAFLVVFIESKN
jgi:hypothetical protein